MGDDADDGVTIPRRLLEALAPLAAQLGVQLPEMGRNVPVIDATKPIGALSLEVGRLVASHDIFLQGEDIVTVDSATGRTTPMGASRFCAYIEQFAAIKVPPRSRRESLAPDDAAMVMRTDNFRSCLRLLTAVNEMRLPVTRRSGDVEFLPFGYDRETGIYTASALPYDMTWSVERATRFLNEHGQEYCFTWADGQARDDISQNRSWAVQVCAMLGTYCRAMFPPGTPRPLFAYTGNKPGTGKSTLAAMALLPSFGQCSATSIPKDADRMISTLETAARSRRPFLFFDDVPPTGIFNNALYQFVLSRSHSGRKMGSNEEFFQEDNVTQVFVSGNDIKFDANLRRRTLVVELFLDQDVRGRSFRRVINPNYLARREVRADFLSALCALVRNFNLLKGSLTIAQMQRIRPLESFEDWTEVITCMCMLAGYTDPLVEPELAGSGDVEADELREVLIHIATAAEGDSIYALRDIVRVARSHGLLWGIVGAQGSGELDCGMEKKLGLKLGKLRGQIYEDRHGRTFRWSKRKQKTGAAYPLEFVEVEKGGPEFLTPLEAAPFPPPAIW